MLAARLQILNALFPEGIKPVEIWHKLIAPLRGKVDSHLMSIDVLEKFIEQKFKLKRRITRIFPREHEQLWIIQHGDTSLLLKITRRASKFHDSHRQYSNHATVIHGDTFQEQLLDWAAQSVITMLIRHLNEDI